MPISRIEPYDDPLDVLWRHVPTPFQAMVFLDQFPVLVESNDPQITSLVTDMTGGKSGQAVPPFLWRIVRDVDSLGSVQPALVLTHGDLTFANMGAAMTVGVDRARRELLVYVGAAVGKQTLKESVLPLLIRLTLDAIRQDEAPEIESADLSIGDSGDNA